MHLVRIAQQCIRQEAAPEVRQVQPQALDFAKHVIVLTMFPVAEFAAAEVPEWCGLRLHVGLVFKRFESLAGLAHLPERGDESARAWQYGRLVVDLLVEKLIGRVTAVSPWRYRLAARAVA